MKILDIILTSGIVLIALIATWRNFYKSHCKLCQGCASSAKASCSSVKKLQKTLRRLNKKQRSLSSSHTVRKGHLRQFNTHDS